MSKIAPYSKAIAALAVGAVGWAVTHQFIDAEQGRTISDGVTALATVLAVYLAPRNKT